MSGGVEADRIALLGMGLMGAPMAQRLADTFGSLTVWNRSPLPADTAARRDLHVAATAAEAAGGAEIVITMLTDGAAVEEVLFARGVAEALAPGALVIDMSSIAPAEARGHAARLAELGLSCLDAPVSGGTVGARSGELAIMVGGARTDFDRAARVFAPLGRAVHLGPPGAGQVAKLANQLIVGLTIAGVAEGLALARAGGLDLERFVEAIGGGLAASTVLAQHGPRMIEGDFTTRGRSTTHLKDIRNALGHAEELGVALPFGAVLERAFAALIDRHGDVDHSGLILALDGAGGRGRTTEGRLMAHRARPQSAARE